MAEAAAGAGAATQGQRSLPDAVSPPRGGLLQRDSNACDDPPALAKFRREAGEASTVITLEGNRQLQCTVRPLPTEEPQDEEASGDGGDHEDALTTTTVTTAATTTPETIATVSGIEILFAFRQAVFGPHDRRKLFMHWGVGSRPDAWEAFPANFSTSFWSSVPTTFKSGNAAETEFPSPSSTLPPVVRFIFRAPQLPVCLSFLFFSVNESAPHEGLLWIRQQHPRGSNVTVNLHRSLQQTLQQRCFLQQVTRARQKAAAAAALQGATRSRGTLQAPDATDLSPLLSPEACL